MERWKEERRRRERNSRLDPNRLRYPARHGVKVDARIPARVPKFHGPHVFSTSSIGKG